MNGWGWFALALLNALWARRRNRSGLNWFVISLFVGPLATILIRVWPRLPEAGTTNSTSWTSGQLASGATVAIVGAAFCSWAALAFDGGLPLWTLCGLYLIGAGAFTWILVRQWMDRLLPIENASP